MAERFPYEDIINVPRHISKVHPQVSMTDRAARFSPFAAISGYEDMVREAARVTEVRVEITDAAKKLLNEKLNMIAERLCEAHEVTITYFEPDKKKSGGVYIAVTGVVKRIDELKKIVVMKDNKKIRIDDIYALDSDFFHALGAEE